MGFLPIFGFLCLYVCSRKKFGFEPKKMGQGKEIEFGTGL